MGIVATELTALSYNAERTEAQSVLVTYTEPRRASPQPLLLDFVWPWKSSPEGPGITGPLLRAQAALD